MEDEGESWLNRPRVEIIAQGANHEFDGTGLAQPDTGTGNLEGKRRDFNLIWLQLIMYRLTAWISRLIFMFIVSMVDQDFLFKQPNYPLRGVNSKYQENCQ